MQSPPLQGWTTSDWNSYWKREGPSREVVAAQKRWVRRLTMFSRMMGCELDSIADFGCGPAIALFELARRFPKASSYGFDTSSTIVRKNTDRARSLGLSNVLFRKAQLPNVRLEYRFGLVLCVATLHYVRDNLLAIQNLYSTLKPGGFLIFNYPNLYTMRWYRSNSDSHMRRRFAILLSGRNILSKKKIEYTLGNSTHNFWTTMGEEVHRANPCLFVRKPLETAPYRTLVLG